MEQRLKELALAGRLRSMGAKDLTIVIALMLVCVFGLKPILNIFKVVLNDRKNPKSTPGMRRFVLFWLALGMLCCVFLFFALAYSVGARLGWLPDFKL